MYCNVRAKFCRGVKQGDPLSSALFNLVIDQAVRVVHQSGVRYEFSGQRVSILAYADDIVLVSETL